MREKSWNLKICNELQVRERGGGNEMTERKRERDTSRPSSVSWSTPKRRKWSHCGEPQSCEPPFLFRDSDDNLSNCNTV